MTTFLKRGAEQFLTVNGGEPLYVQWNYGTGRVGSFTADLRGSDSEELYRSEDGQQLIKNMVAAVIRGDGKVTALEVAVTPGNQTAIIDVSASLKGKESIVVTVLAPDNKEQIVETILTTDGTCQGVFDSSIPGTYTVTVTHLSADGELLDHTRTHFASSYSAEYDAFTTLDGEALLAQISEVTGGKMSYTLSGVLDFTGQYLEQELDPTVALLVVVLVLFLGDIAVRKFRLRWFKTQKTNKNV